MPFIPSAEMLTGILHRRRAKSYDKLISKAYPKAKKSQTTLETLDMIRLRCARSKIPKGFYELRIGYTILLY